MVHPYILVLKTMHVSFSLRVPCSSADNHIAQRIRFWLCNGSITLGSRFHELNLQFWGAGREEKVSIEDIKELKPKIKDQNYFV